MRREDFSVAATRHGQLHVLRISVGGTEQMIYKAGTNHHYQQLIASQGMLSVICSIAIQYITSHHSPAIIPSSLVARLKFTMMHRFRGFFGIYSHLFALALAAAAMLFAR